MLTHVSQKADQVVRRERLLSEEVDGLGELPTRTELLDNPMEQTISMRWSSSTDIVDIVSSLDPLGHALHCVRGSLDAGYQIVRAIEVALGIPVQARIGSEAEAQSNSGAPDTNFMLPSAAALTSELYDDFMNDSCMWPGNENNTEGPESLTDKLLDMLWVEQGGRTGTVSPQEAARATIVRCRKELAHFARQHAATSRSV